MARWRLTMQPTPKAFASAGWLTGRITGKWKLENCRLQQSSGSPAVADLVLIRRTNHRGGLRRQGGRHPYDCGAFFVKCFLGPVIVIFHVGLLLTSCYKTSGRENQKRSDPSTPAAWIEKAPEEVGLDGV